MKKILIVIIVLLFVCSSLPVFIGQAEKTVNLNERIFKEDRSIIPIYTDHGLKFVPTGKGKPPANYITIISPLDGAIVSGTVNINLESNVNPTITIDGIIVGSGLNYVWDTTQYVDGSHTIKAYSGKLKDTHIVTVSNSGGNGGDGVVKKYALLIGISDYDGTQNDLQYCDDDAMDWKNFLQGEGYTIYILTDSLATAANIESEVINLLAIEDADDYVVFTYSGHGNSVQGYGSCIVSHDLYYISHGFFESYFNNADSQQIYFTFDACKIGGFQGLIQTNRVGSFASNNKYSYDGDSTMQNGVFTYYQMKGWITYNNFEEDAAYAVQYMKNWASIYHIQVDPFYVDQFAGLMTP